MSSFCENEFNNQIIVVTGGARGIGFGVACEFCRRGGTVVIVDIGTKKTLKDAARKMTKDGGRGDVERIDVTSPDAVDRGIKNIIKRHGTIHVLVQCAGITGKTGIRTEDVAYDNFRTVFAVNLDGIFLMCKAVLPIMKKQRYGRIVNIASIAGKEGNAGMLAYSSSKAAVVGLTKVIGKEYAEDGITCNAIAPAVVRTPMVDAMPASQVKYMTDKIPMKRTGEILEIASLVAFVASKNASFTTAFTWDATGGRATY